MAALRWLTAALRLAGIWKMVTDAVKRASWHAAVLAVAGLIWLVALSFGIASLTVWLSAMFGVPAGLGIVAGGLAVLGLIAYLVVATDSRKQRTGHSLASAMAEAQASARESAQGEGAESAEDGALQSVAALAFVGYVLGRLARPS